MKSGTYTGGGQEQYSVGASEIGAVLNNYNFGGVNGFGILIIEAAQLSLLIDNYNTAENYYDVNKQDFDFFVSNYESKMVSSLNEAISRPVYEGPTFLPQYGKLDYLSSIGRGASAGPRILDKKWYDTRRRVGKYHIGLGRWIDYKFAMAKVQSTLDGWNIGFRYEDHRKEVYNEQRHAHRTNILNLGIGVGNAARAGLASSVGALTEARSNVSSQLGSIGNGLATNASYQGTKKGLMDARAGGSNLATQTSGIQNKYITGSDSTIGSNP